MFVTWKIIDYSARHWNGVQYSTERGKLQKIWNEEIIELKWK
jgi:hypothetical protein